MQCPSTRALVPNQGNKPQAWPSPGIVASQASTETVDILVENGAPVKKDNTAMHHVFYRSDQDSRISIRKNLLQLGMSVNSSGKYPSTWAGVRLLLMLLSWVGWLKSSSCWNMGLILRLKMGLDILLLYNTLYILRRYACSCGNRSINLMP